MNPSPQSSRAPAWRWWITGMLFLATAINYMDRVSLGGASVRITHEFGLNEVQYGNLELSFGWAFAAGSLVFGFLADRWSAYVLYPAVLAAWSLMGMATGWSHSYLSLLACRTLLGFFEAGQWPCALKTTFALLDEKDRTLGNSVLQSGGPIGAVIMPQILKLMMTAQTGSWRLPFIVVGAIGLLWVVGWFLCLRPRDLALPSAAAAAAPALPLWTILRSGRFWALALLLMGPQTVWQIYRVWLMKFLESGRGYGEKAALDFNSLYYLATDLGCFAAGLASVWLIRRRGKSPHRARRSVYFGGCLLTSLSLLLPWLGPGWPLLATLLLIGAGALALFPCFYSFTQELSPSHVGRMTGLLGMLGWAVTSPLHSLFGFIVDRTHSYDAGLLIAGLVPWLGVLSMRLLWKADPTPTIEN